MRFWHLAALLVLAGCSAPLGPAGFAQTRPVFDPVAFFTGHVTSWGVEENRGGQPIAIVKTDCQGVVTGPGRIAMVQVLHVGNAPPQTRRWQLWQAGQGYEATANDMAGHTTGWASGRALHWRWVLETRPGNPLLDVTMDQFMFRMDDGSVMIRTVVTKFGVRVVEVSERFAKA
jgi:hypothetical protein